MRTAAQGGGRTRFLGFDLARSIAIAMLLVAHIAQQISSPLGGFFGIPGFYYVSLGGLAVTLFLVLSGTVLELSHGKEAISYQHFVVGRVLRIYPVYYMSLLIGIVFYAARSYTRFGNPFTAFSQLGWSDAVLSLTGFYGFAGKWGGPFVATSWFVGLIMTMYLVYPFLSRWIKKRPLASLAILLLASVASRVLLGKYQLLPGRPLDWFPISRVFEFSLGIYLATFLPKRIYEYRIAGGWVGTSVTFVAMLSFPLFLVHYPMLGVISALTVRGVNAAAAIALFLALAFLASWIIYQADQKIPRKRILRKIAEAGSRSS